MFRRSFGPPLRLGAALSVILVLAGATSAGAGICDYRLSQVIASRAPALASAGLDRAALSALGANDRDFFTLVNPSTGMSTLGAVVAVVGQAEAVGRVAGAVQLLGAGGTVLSGPAIGMAAGAAALGLGGLEGLCRFKDEKISDYYEVLALLSVIAETSDPKLFQLQLGPARKKGAVVEVWDPVSEVRKQYRVDELFFRNGELIQSRWGRDKSLGHLMQFENPSAEFALPKAP